MKRKFEEELKKSNLIHIPLPVNQEEYAEYSIHTKPAVESLHLGACEKPESWFVDAPGSMTVSGEFSEHG